MDDVRLIDANKLLKSLECKSITTKHDIEAARLFEAGIIQCLKQFVIPKIESAPTVDLERPTGEWELGANYDDLGLSYRCTNCGEYVDEDCFYPPAAICGTPNGFRPFEYFLIAVQRWT